MGNLLSRVGIYSLRVVNILTVGENYFLLMWGNCCSRVVICWSGVRKLLSTWLKLLFKCSRVEIFCSHVGWTVHVNCEYKRGSHWFLIILVYSHDIGSRQLFWVNGWQLKWQIGNKLSTFKIDSCRELNPRPPALTSTHEFSEFAMFSLKFIQILLLAILFRKRLLSSTWNLFRKCYSNKLEQRL